MHIFSKLLALACLVLMAFNLSLAPALAQDNSPANAQRAATDQDQSSPQKPRRIVAVRVVEPDPEGDKMQAACDAGDMDKCLEFGIRYSSPLGGHVDYDRALEVLRKACDSNRGFASCARLGYLYVTGRGVEKNLETAVAYYLKSCEGKIGEGCKLLGDHYYTGEGVEENDMLAVRYYEEACDYKYYFGCHLVGEIFMVDAFDNIDDKRAAAANSVVFYDRGCDGGIWQSCDALASIFEQGKGLGKDVSRAAIYYQKLCGLYQVSGCSKVAPMYEHGVGVEKNLSLASRYYQEACDLFDKDACMHLADMYIKGRVVEKNAPEALKIYKQACSQSQKQACIIVAGMYEKGEGVAQDHDQASEYYKFTCLHFYWPDGCPYSEKAGKGDTGQATGS